MSQAHLLGNTAAGSARSKLQLDDFDSLAHILNAERPLIIHSLVERFLSVLFVMMPRLHCTEDGYDDRRIYIFQVIHGSQQAVSTEDLFDGIGG